jgi:ArsR family transcriptional regulator
VTDGVFLFVIATIQLLLNNCCMDKTTATSVFESLASGVRLDVFRLLVKQGPEGLVAGEIAAALGLPATNLSFHLKALTQAGLLTATQEGRYQRYRAHIALMVELIAYLTDECCAGHPEACLPTDAMAVCTSCA